MKPYDRLISAANNFARAATASKAADLATKKKPALEASLVAARKRELTAALELADALKPLEDAIRARAEAVSAAGDGK